MIKKLFEDLPQGAVFRIQNPLYDSKFLMKKNQSNGIDNTIYVLTRYTTREGRLETLNSTFHCKKGTQCCDVDERLIEAVFQHIHQMKLIPEPPLDNELKHYLQDFDLLCPPSLRLDRLIFKRVQPKIDWTTEDINESAKHNN